MKRAGKIKDIHLGDCLSFRTSDNRYKAIFCTSINKTRSPHGFSFAATTFNNEIKPTVEDLMCIDFWGKGNRNSFRYSDSEIEKMWIHHPNIKPFFLGTYGILILRKEFIQMRDNFDLIGNLSIINNLEMNGSGSFYPGNFENLDNFFTQNLEKVMDQRGQNKFMFKAIIID